MGVNPISSASEKVNVFSTGVLGSKREESRREGGGKRIQFSLKLQLGGVKVCAGESSISSWVVVTLPG